MTLNFPGGGLCSPPSIHHLGDTEAFITKINGSNRQASCLGAPWGSTSFPGALVLSLTSRSPGRPRSVPRRVS